MTDALLSDDNDSGEIYGIDPTGLRTSVYIRLFGGTTFWGWSSETQEFMDKNEPIPANLGGLTRSVERDLEDMLTEGSATSIAASVAMIAPRRVQLTIDVGAVEGDVRLTFEENWQNDNNADN